jgi:hypothetical protein
MANVDVNHDYLMTINKQQLSCTYELKDGVTGAVIATGTTPHKKPSWISLSYFHVLYFGGSETTTQPVTASYAFP